jgi:hypothetical protein
MANKLVNDCLNVIRRKETAYPPLGIDASKHPPTMIDGVAFEDIRVNIGRVLTKLAMLLAVKQKAEENHIWDSVKKEWEAENNRCQKIIEDFKNAIEQ